MISFFVRACFLFFCFYIFINFIFLLFLRFASTYLFIFSTPNFLFLSLFGFYSGPYSLLSSLSLSLFFTFPFLHIHFNFFDFFLILALIIFAELLIVLYFLFHLFIIIFSSIFLLSHYNFSPSSFSSH